MRKVALMPGSVARVIGMVKLWPLPGSGVAAASLEVWLGVLESTPWRSCHPYCFSQRATHAPDDFNVVGSVDILTLLPFALPLLGQALRVSYGNWQ